MVNNVMQLQRPANKPSYSQKLRNAEEAMDVVRSELYGHHPENIATAIGCCVSTIYAIRAGRTKWPRPTTFFPLIDALGLEMRLVKAT